MKSIEKKNHCSRPHCENDNRADWVEIRLRAIGVFCLCFLFVLACDDENAQEVSDESDAGDAASDTTLCQSDEDCADFRFCNGIERCIPGYHSADDNGCVHGTASPCSATQICDEEIDKCITDCNINRDADGDGFDALECDGDDCDDTDADRFPGNHERCDEANHDEDCNPETFGDRDRDRDGFVDALCCNLADDGTVICGDDCDDLDRAVHPAATEDCDEIDNDCDLSTDEGVRVNGYYDADCDLHGDPYRPLSACAGALHFAQQGDDCDDTNPARHAAQQEICDEIDNDCDGLIDDNAVPVTWYPDNDGDGFGAESDDTVESCEPVEGYSLLSTDCDDSRADVSPRAAELCDRLDNNCDGRTDEDVLSEGFHDADGDGYGDETLFRIDCAQADNFSLRGDDCDDSNKNRHPDHVETCDEIDNDCDGDVDEGVRVEGYLDSDRDLHGDSDHPISRCVGTVGFALVDDDCDDDNAAINPSQSEFCDSLDNDCDGETDEETHPITWYRDQDGDGYGDPMGETELSCVQPEGYALLPFDCDDHDAATSPSAEERCDGLDNDCNGRADYLIEAGNFEDDDGDRVPDRACAENRGDCDDNRASVRPDAPELCDNIDNDCDGQIDEDANIVDWYVDLDRDEYGDQYGEVIESCAPIKGRVPRGGDCDDSDARIKPGVSDICDSIDNDCDGETDEDATQFAFFADADGDGYSGGRPVLSCRALTGYSETSLDCDDTDPGLHPGAAESCDGVDNDCDGEVDEGVLIDGYLDRDGDLHGDPDTPIASCAGGDRFSLVGDDCNDYSTAIHAAQLEICDGIDNNCNGEVDEGAAPVNWYPDTDADGFGDADGESRLSCYPLPGYALLNTDCDDQRASIRPNSVEQCDGIDNDCDGQIDEGLRGLYPEICDGVEDEDCDGAVDEGCDCIVGTVRACGTSDQGQCILGVQVCEADAVWSFCLGAIGPSGEICDGLDNDCDGLTDNVPGGC
jgi:hypothetical protein